MIDSFCTHYASVGMEIFIYNLEYLLKVLLKIHLYLEIQDFTLHMTDIRIMWQREIKPTKSEAQNQ